MYQRIVVPLDGSALAERALPDAERLARLVGAPIHLLRVVDLTQLPWYGQFGMTMEYTASEQVLAADNDAAAAYLQTVAERLSASGLTVTSEVRRGPTPLVIVDTAKTGDLVVMASHGRTGLTRWFIGSVAEEVLRRATVPILLIKSSDAAPNESPAPAGTAG